MTCGTLLLCFIGLNFGVAQVGAIKNWAILVAGSNGWYNYRHQADVSHAYQLLWHHGIPAENIITMMYDDVAGDYRNRYPGQLFNDYSHKDVYRGVKVDYRGGEVTPENFLRVLAGDPKLKAAGKKVLESGPDDNVFIFFSDHGAPHLIAFPNGELDAQQLKSALVNMHQSKRYKKMVIYIEACYSGSMFYHILPNDMNIFVTTAANEAESSWACFCDDSKISTCLADEYSYKWMEDSEHHPLKKWTLQMQYSDVKQAVRKSHVMEYGDLRISSDALASYQAHGNTGMAAFNSSSKPVEIKDSRPASQAHIYSMMRHAMMANSVEERDSVQRRLHRAIQLGHLVKEMTDEIVQQVRQDNPVPVATPITVEEQLDCYLTSFKQYKIRCSTIQQVPEVASELIKINQLCASGYDARSIIQAIHDVCG